MQSFAKAIDDFHSIFFVNENILIDLLFLLTYTVNNRYILTLIL